MSYNKNKVIRAHGFQVIFLGCILIIMIITSIFGIIISFIDNIKYHWHELMIYTILLCISIYYMYKFIIYSSKIIFNENNHLIIAGTNPYLKPIDICCSNIISYERVNKLCYKFDTDKESFYLYRITFTKKQMILIIQEIKDRGGLQNFNKNN